MKTGRRGRLLLTLTSTTALITLALSLVPVTGCKKPPRIRDDDSKKEAHVDPWKSVEKNLKKDTDYVSCQSALRNLNDSFRNDDTLVRPASLTPDHEQALAGVPLNPDDREEIRNWTFSPHDSIYLAECFYLHDAAQSLKLPNLSPEQLADLGFAWVCRSVFLKNLVIPDRNRIGLVVPALPPTSVLRRGYGSALERMYVFLALLQQLDLEACLIGPPNAGDAGGISSSIPLPRDRVYSGGPVQPFWAIGVRIGSDIKLYDPWRGEAFPANLSQLKANPDAYKNWFENDANRSKLKPDDVKAATVFLAVPVNALSPRMEMLHGKLKDTFGVRLAINAKTFRSTFPDPKPLFWNPPDDRFAYGRTARMFLPRDRGGADETPFPHRLYDDYIRDQLPPPEIITASLPSSEILDSDTRNRLIRVVQGIYLHTFIETTDLVQNTREQSPRQEMAVERDWNNPIPNPRERIQRGQFQDAIQNLVEKQSRFSKDLELLRNTPDADLQIRDWCQVTKKLYLDYDRTVLVNDKDERASAKMDAQGAIERHWRDDWKPVELMINRAAAPICRAEAAFLRALCKHEMAERKQARADYAKGEDAAELKKQAIEAWKDALQDWQTYQEFNAPQAYIQGRIAEANALAERAAKLAKK